ncbi:glycosyltransferase family 2 protein [Cognatilysobacter lacus]|uniref:Glycosyltransferase family 2 protein n=1 Tax=Cognatilysobacter lacus TaxID=1643323 RepID=A0A5D8Z9E9_9GAMM|nr:glycosyltransferase family 2 protein [Lysobacter lacus]TZF91196.1 glycosyltransferase family 2 protein [Lysobacter lacus]
MISFVILTYNEAANLPRCLASVAWSDDIVVMDSGSTDATGALAEAAGARILVRPFDTFAHQRNHAMGACEFRNRWVFHLDADEVVTDDLRRELCAIADSGESPFPVYRVPSRLIFMGTWLKHSGLYPSYQVRFGRADELRFVDHGHGQREVQPPELVGTLRAPLDHYNFSKGVNDWLARHLRYAHAEAMQSQTERSQPVAVRELVHGDPTRRRRALKRAAARLPMRPLLRFLYVYFVRRGFLDGRAGLDYAVMIAVYQYFIGLNERELTNGR